MICRDQSIYTIFLAGGSFVGGLGGGYIASIQGYKYIFWITTAILAFVLLGELLLVPETSFDREAQFLAERDTNGYTGDSVSDAKANVEMLERALPHRRPQDTFPFAQSLKIGVYRGNLLRNVLAPWLSLAFPGTWVVMLQ